MLVNLWPGKAVRKMASPNRHERSVKSTADLIQDSEESQIKLITRLLEQERNNSELNQELESLRLRSTTSNDYERQIQLLTNALDEERKSVTRLTDRLREVKDKNEQQLLTLQQALNKNEQYAYRLRERHAAISEKRVKSDQKRTEDTLSTNRQSELEREYMTEFKDGRRVDAIETITRSSQRHFRQNHTMDHVKACRLTCFIFEVAYECALGVKDSFIALSSSVLETLVAEAPAIGLHNSSFSQKYFYRFHSREKSAVPPDAFSELMILVKEEASKHNLSELVENVKRAVEDKWRICIQGLLPYHDYSLMYELTGYIEYCTQFAWRIVTQVPPLKLDYVASTYNPKDHTESQSFTFTGQKYPSDQNIHAEPQQIECYLWPTLHDCDDRVLAKGEVILAYQDKMAR